MTWGCNITVASFHAHTQTCTCFGHGITQIPVFYVAMCLIKPLNCPNWPFWCASFDVRGCERAVESVKPIKETGLLSAPQPCGKWKRRAKCACSPGDPHAPSHTCTNRHLFTFSPPAPLPKLRLGMISEASNSWRDLRVGQGYPLCKNWEHKEMWGLGRAKETESLR